jgi:cell wall-associated NlpC family hydrolase
MTHTTLRRFGRAVTVSLAAAMMIGAFQGQTPAIATAPQTVPAAAVAQIGTVALQTPAKAPTVAQRAVLRQQKRYSAMRYALTKAGTHYVWGAAGPNSFDCSGLVMWAYGKVGMHMPHNTGAMMGSGKLRHISKSQVRWGDPVFFGPGHVEFFAHWGKGRRTVTTFGAHNSRVRNGYRTVSMSGGWKPTMYYQVR